MDQEINTLERLNSVNRMLMSIFESTTHANLIDCHEDIASKMVLLETIAHEATGISQENLIVRNGDNPNVVNLARKAVQDAYTSMISLLEILQPLFDISVRDFNAHDQAEHQRMATEYARTGRINAHYRN